MKLTLFFLSTLLISIAGFAAPGDVPTTPANPPATPENPTPAPPVNCRRDKCPLYAVVNLTKQRIAIVVEGVPTYKWKISSGDWGWETPNLETHPDGRVFDKYSSHDHPGGPEYEDLGNMPYAVFVDGGIAIHGTAEENWDYLGEPASHGCIRLHPDNAKIFNRLVRKYGVQLTWVSIIGEYEW